MVVGDCGGNETFPGLIFTAYRVISGIYSTGSIIWGLTQGKIIILLRNAEGYWESGDKSRPGNMDSRRQGRWVFLLGPQWEKPLLMLA